MEWLIEWWDGFELWLVQLPYPLLVALVIGVLLPVCWALAGLVDRVIDETGAKLTRVQDAQPPVGRREGASDGQAHDRQARTPRGGPDGS